jgi:dTDP-4-amino-4,6-dideoxygalactose transaminase
MPTIPIMRPKLPSWERLAPYMTQIDASRVYSNFGPLVLSLEERLAARFGLASSQITTLANATLGLTLALAAQGAQPGTLCVMPAWTFIASAHAATMAGLIPYFVDVDKETWALNPEVVASVMSEAPAAVGAIMPVAPFGRPIDIGSWDRFRSRTGLPVVVDAAAGFDAMSPGSVPAVVSMHATKIHGAGEGGFVASTDSEVINDIRTRSNFGFRGSRDSAMHSANAKLSEYHAAVALAGLDEWSTARDEWMAVASAYRDELSELNQVWTQDGMGHSWIATTCVLEMTERATPRIEQELASAAIDTRRWWGSGAHTHPVTARYPRASLDVTEGLARSTIAVPFYRDMRRSEVQAVAGAVRAAVKACAS